MLDTLLEDGLLSMIQCAVTINYVQKDGIFSFQMINNGFDYNIIHLSFGRQMIFMVQLRSQIFQIQNVVLNNVFLVISGYSDKSTYHCDSPLVNKVVVPNLRLRFKKITSSNSFGKGWKSYNIEKKKVTKNTLCWFT